MGWAIAYDIFLIASCGYALLRGGGPERAGAWIMLAGSFLTWGALLLFGHRHTQLEVGILLVDVTMLGALVWLALSADRYWPLYAAGLHLIGVSTHGAIYANAPIARLAYAHALGLWSYLTLLCLVAGTRDRQKRLIAAGRSSANSSTPSSTTSGQQPTN